MPVFSTTAMPVPDRIGLVNLNHSESQKTLRSPFNDGYLHTVPDGINSMLSVWDITWVNCDLSERTTIIGVLRAVGGSGVLAWTPYFETTERYFKVVEGFQETFSSGVHSNIAVQLFEVK